MNKPVISLSGVFPPVPTPFDAEGEVAIRKLIENLERWNQYDLSGYVVLGSNGEAGFLSVEEKLRVLEAARQAIPPDKLMIAGAGCESTRQTIALTRQAAQAGADAALLVTPHYYDPQMTPGALAHHYEAVADGAPIPVLLYTVPKFTHVDIDTATVARLARHPNIIGIKDTGGNMAKMADTVRLTGPDFQVLAGSAGFFLAGLTLGAVGGILALSNVAPKKCLDLYQLFQAGKMEEAAALQRWMIPVNAAITARFGIAGLKVALEMLGYYGGPVRSPLLALTGEEQRALWEVLTEGGLL
ncbi:MAG: dihydrodipicolinate synthase family protein [Chloroflexi bacterium]|nr:MAG: dihydrodipicolinate synthase family protein [Chloroflexota bacterium]